MQTNYDVNMQLDVKVSMRDGINLSADIYLPRAHGKYPTVLMRTPYDNNATTWLKKLGGLPTTAMPVLFRLPWTVGLRRGILRLSGRRRWVRHSGMDWQARMVQWQNRHGRQFLWRHGPVAQRAVSQPVPQMHTPRVICTDYYSGLVHPGGAFQLNVMMTWGMRTNARTAQTIEFHNWTEAFRALPLIEMDEQAGRNLNFWKDWVEHAAYDDYWEQFNDETKWGEIAVPAFNMGGWYDLYAAQTFTNFNGLRLHGRTEEAKKSKLIVGPWPHSSQPIAQNRRY